MELSCAVQCYAWGKIGRYKMHVSRLFVFFFAFIWVVVQIKANRRGGNRRCKQAKSVPPPQIHILPESNLQIGLILNKYGLKNVI